MTSVFGNVKTENHELLSEVDAPDVDQLAAVEMGRAERETKGGLWGTNDFHFGFQG